MRKRMYLFASLFAIMVIGVTALSYFVYKEAEQTINRRKNCPLCKEN